MSQAEKKKWLIGLVGGRFRRFSSLVFISVAATTCLLLSGAVSSINYYLSKLMKFGSFNG
jgi:hypothetical protein